MPSSGLNSNNNEMNIGFQDQFNLPGEMQGKISNEIRIVSYGGEIKDPKRVGSRGLVSRNRPPVSIPNQTSDPMVSNLPKYTYTEDRP